MYHSAAPAYPPKLQAIDLFCGVGGLSYGLQEAGIEVLAGLDIDPACKYPYSENNDAEFICGDLAEVPTEQLISKFSTSAMTLIAGCAPCQPFSTLRNGHDRKTNDKWPILRDFARVVSEALPDFVTMENVPVLKTQEIFGEFRDTLKSLGYQVFYTVVDAAAYGVPQRRRRLILLASRRGPIRLATPSELGVTNKTVRDAIGNLPRLLAGEADPHDELHKARALSPTNLRRIKASRPGGTWEDWPEDLRLDCHKREAGRTFKSVYGRLEWDKPSGTMTTQSYNFGTGRFGHPEQDRSISLREMAILQSFPAHYKFVEEGKPLEFSTVGRMIGNAVPVGLGYAIGISIKMAAWEAANECADI